MSSTKSIFFVWSWLVEVQDALVVCLIKLSDLMLLRAFVAVSPGIVNVGEHSSTAWNVASEVFFLLLLSEMVGAVLAEPLSGPFVEECELFAGWKAISEIQSFKGLQSQFGLQSLVFLFDLGGWLGHFGGLRVQCFLH